MSNRKPMLSKSIPCGHKLYAALEKLSKERGETIELIVSKALWLEVNR